MIFQFGGNLKEADLFPKKGFIWEAVYGKMYMEK